MHFCHVLHIKDSNLCLFPLPSNNLALLLACCQKKVSGLRLHSFFHSRPAVDKKLDIFKSIFWHILFNTTSFWFKYRIYPNMKRFLYSLRSNVVLFIILLLCFSSSLCFLHSFLSRFCHIPCADLCKGAYHLSPPKACDHECVGTLAQEGPTAPRRPLAVIPSSFQVHICTVLLCAKTQKKRT